MRLDPMEKKVAHDIIKQHLERYRRDEVKRDVPPSFLKAEKEYEKFLVELVKKFS